MLPGVGEASVSPPEPTFTAPLRFWSMIMKVFIFTLIAILAVGFLNSTSYTVDNNIRSIGQYSTWISAYNAAADGDTIYIYPSPYDYGPGWNEGSLGKRLTVIGGGFNPTNPALITSKISLYVNSAGGTGSIFSGLHITNSVASSQEAHYINCRFESTVNLQAALSELKYCWCVGNVYAGNDVHVMGCSLQSSLVPASQSDVTCSNSVFIGNVSHIDTGGNSNASCYLMNCLFVNSGEGSHILFAGWGSPNDLNFVNCIMESITIYAAQTFSYCLFEGNSTYVTDPSNLQDVNLANVMVDVNGGDYHLSPGSLAIGAGLGGVDIGIYGGNTPFNDLWYLTRLPSITGFTCPIVVDENGLLNVHIEAQAGN